MNPKEHVYFTGLGLEPDQQVRISCPWHNSVDNDMVIRRSPTHISYYCFSVKCGEKGTLPVQGSPNYNAPQGAKSVSHTYYPPEGESLSLEDYRLFYDKFELTQDILQKNYVRAYNGNYLFPLYNLQGQETGYLVRSYRGTGPKVISKWKAVQEVVRPKTCPIGHSQIILVEDYISALKLSPMAEVVSLMGCNLSPKCLVALSHKYSQLVLALDPDEAGRISAAKIAGQARVLFSKITYLPLRKDVKDTPYAELTALVGEILGKQNT